jgi:hypothetical protein
MAETKVGRSVSAGQPTPTQAENDLAVLGAHGVDKDPDGRMDHAAALSW